MKTALYMQSNINWIPVVNQNIRNAVNASEDNEKSPDDWDLIIMVILCVLIMLMAYFID